MADFDYVKAWNELAEPAFKALPARVLAVLDRVLVECKNSRQDEHTLALPWPAKPEGAATSVLDDMNEIPSRELALAAQVTYGYGHWCPGGMLYKHVRSGTSWHFANLADEVLKARCGLPSGKKHRDSIGRSFTVCEGLLRVCYASNDIWTWREIGPATPEALEKARLLDLCHRPGTFDDDAMELRRILGEDYPEFVPWVDHERFMTPVYPDEILVREWNTKVLHDSPFAVLEVMHVNYKPHPFVIGPEHMKTDSPYLDPESAPCAFREASGVRCRLPYKAHTSERALALAPKVATDLATLQQWMVKTRPRAELDNIQGFAIVDKKKLIAGLDEAMIRNAKEQP